MSALAAALLTALSLLLPFAAPATAAAPQPLDRSTSTRVHLVALDIDHDGDIDLLAFQEDHPAALWLNDGRGVFQKASFRNLGPEGGGSSAAAARPAEFTFGILLTAPQPEEYTPYHTVVSAGTCFLYRSLLSVRNASFSAPYWVLPRHLVSPLSRRGPPAASASVPLHCC